MIDLRKLIPKVEGAIKRIDPTVIVSGTFYDQVSDRLFLTLVKGPRKVEVTLAKSNVGSDDGMDRLNRFLEGHVSKLQNAPVG